VGQLITRRRTDEKKKEEEEDGGAAADPSIHACALHWTCQRSSFILFFIPFFLRRENSNEWALCFSLLPFIFKSNKQAR